METTMQARGGAVFSVPGFALGVPVVVPSHLADAVRLNGVGRGMWRGQPELGIGAVPAAGTRIGKRDRVNKLDRNATKQFGTTVYEGLRPWKVPV